MTRKNNGKSGGAAVHPIDTLQPRDEEDVEIVEAVIETPQGTRNKYKYDDKTGLFTLHKVLPAGSIFPLSFGFVPQTLADDGDPLDILIFADEPVPVGCVVPARLIGVMEAEQTEGGKSERNDRLVAVAAESRDHEDLKSFKKIDDRLREELEHFFVAYHQMDGKEFRILACRGPATGNKVLEEGIRAHKRGRGNGSKKS